MRAGQEDLLGRAERALRTARLNLDDGDPEAATNRAYHARFYLAQAALADRGEAPKTHSGTHARFAFHYVADGTISAETGSILTDAFKARQRSDYNVAAVTDAQAASDLLRDAERFVAAVRALL